MYLIYCIFDQINVALVSIRDFPMKYMKLNDITESETFEWYM